MPDFRRAAIQTEVKGFFSESICFDRFISFRVLWLSGQNDMMARASGVAKLSPLKNVKYRNLTVYLTSPTEKIECL